MKDLLKRIQLALHVLRGKPLVYNLTFKGQYAREALSAFNNTAECSVHNCTFIHDVHDNQVCVGTEELVYVTCSGVVEAE